MGKLIYSPTDEGDAPAVEAFGVSFTIGKPVDVDAAVFEKLKGNPQFKVAAEKATHDLPAKADTPKAEPAKVDGRSKEARKARAAAEDEAKARAAEHLEDLAEAEEEAKAEKRKG